MKVIVFVSDFRIVTFLAPSVYPTYEAIAKKIGEALDVSIDFQTAGSHDQYEDLQPDMAFVCGLPYVLMRRDNIPVEAIAAPVILSGRSQGLPIYFSDVIVRADAPYQSFEDLRGCRWAYNEKVSQSGYGITRYTLVRMEETQGFFGEVVDAGYHQKAIKLVIKGKVDASAIDSQVLAIEMRDNPELSEQIKIIDILGPSTIQPVVVNTNLPVETIATIQRTLVNLHNDLDFKPILEAGLFEKFVLNNDHSYNDIRAMLKASEDADFLELK